MTTLTIVPPLHFQRPPKLLTLVLPQMCALLEPVLPGESFPLSQTGCTVYSQNSEMRECKNSN